MNMASDYQIRLNGYTSVGKELLLQKFVREGAPSLANLSGQYVIVAEDSNECYIVTSPYGVCQYYYTVCGNRLFHDDTVLGVLQRSNLPWSWNYRALADLALVDHVLENDTLHPQVHRVPPGSILHFRNGVLTTSCLTWEELHPSFTASPAMALAAFNETVGHLITDNVAVSMSGGFDTRVILSALLRHNCRPLLLTMGFDDSTDVIISRQIASALGLPSLVVALQPEDYLKHGSTIVGLTNGAFTAMHWHAFLYLQKAELDADSVLFIGTNGEFARTFHFDKGILAILADMVPQPSLRTYWKRRLRLHSLFRKEDELDGLCEQFANEFTTEGQNLRLQRTINLCYNELLPGLDRFYLEQRVRNFMSNVLKLASVNASWRVPFLSQEWVSAIWNLKRNWKLGANWHRYAIAKNFPALLDFPEAGKSGKMGSRAPLLYWLRAMKRPIEVKPLYPTWEAPLLHCLRAISRRSIVHYANQQEWFREDMFAEFILDNVPLLAELIEPKTAASIVKENKRDGSRTRTIAFLLTMIFWLMGLRGIERPFTDKAHPGIQPIGGPGRAG
jgi:hypothetical protein